MVLMWLYLLIGICFLRLLKFLIWERVLIVFRRVISFWKLNELLIIKLEKKNKIKYI